MKKSLTNEVFLSPSSFPEEELFFVKKESNVTINTNKGYLSENFKVYGNEEKKNQEIAKDHPFTNEADEILASNKAVIYEITGSHIKLKLQEGVFINIPKDVFSNKYKDLKYGQDVIYSIKKRKNGQRYQDIDINLDKKVNPYQDKVLNVLKQITTKK